MHQIRFRPGSAPDPLRELTALPDPLAGLTGPTSKGRGAKGTGKEGGEAVKGTGNRMNERRRNTI